VKDLKIEQYAYYAGFFDGEGCVRLSKSGSGGYTLHVKFHITYSPILYELHKIYGGTVSKCDMDKVRNQRTVVIASINKLTNPMNFKDRFSYDLTGESAYRFLVSILPYCREKKKQVEMAIEFFEGKKRKVVGHNRTNKETKRCEYFDLKLRDLKKHDIIISQENKCNCQKSLFSYT